jgi:catechol 2,3-dioxygenase-like lactoylglutathione lyase family enzyme
MSGLGRFLEVSVRTADVPESLNWYKMLGFKELETGDMWTHRYAVVSDGVLCIGLHDREFDSPAITFVQPDLARHARSRADHGFNFSFMRLGEESFNEIGVTDRDGHLITMVEARTFHGDDEDDNDSVCGTWFELTLPVRDAMRSAHFWGPVAGNILSMREEPTMHMRFDAGGIALGLSESIALEQPSLCFKCHDEEVLQSLASAQDLGARKFPGFEGAFLVLVAPEGTPLFVFKEDFLGEAIEVDEDVDPSEIEEFQ